MGRIGRFPQTLAWIHAAVSEKHEITHGRRAHEDMARSAV